MRTTRTAIKPKGKEITKSSPIIYEHEDGPITRLTLKGLYDHFTIKIAELSPSPEGTYSRFIISTASTIDFLL